MRTILAVTLSLLISTPAYTETVKSDYGNWQFMTNIDMDNPKEDDYGVISSISISAEPRAILYYKCQPGGKKVGKTVNYVHYIQTFNNIEDGHYEVEYSFDTLKKKPPISIEFKDGIGSLGDYFNKFSPEIIRENRNVVRFNLPDGTTHEFLLDGYRDAEKVMTDACVSVALKSIMKKP